MKERLTCFLLFLATFGECAKILAVVPAAMYSHQTAYQPIWKELLKRGHELTLVTPNPMDIQAPNLKQIDLSHLYKFVKEENLVGIMINEGEGIIWYTKVFKLLGKMSNAIWTNEDLGNLLRNKNETFDLLITEAIGSLLRPLSLYYQIPTIGIFSMEPDLLTHLTSGNYINSILYPDINSGLVGELSFLQRLKAAFGCLVFNLLNLVPKQVPKQMVQFINKTYTQQDLVPKYDTLFIIDNPICRIYRPVAPTTVYLRGLQIKKNQQLPQDIQSFLDNSKQGALYFSLGSNINSVYLKEYFVKILLDAFAELPYNVLWKFDVELENVPKNIFVSKWVLQQGVLDHPNVKLFITQGGCHSLEETIHSKVPILGMPFFGDQFSNIKRAELQGIGLSVDRHYLSKENFKNAILEVMTNKKYQEAINRLHNIAFDQPISAIDSAMWHIEYVIRNNGTHHLKSKSMNDLPFYQYYLLDVIGFLALVFMVLLTIIYLVIKTIFVKIFNDRRKKEKNI